jgi:hypothetical protein
MSTSCLLVGWPGLSADESVSAATLSAVNHLAQTRRTIYLPTHDPQLAVRLAASQRVGASLDNVGPKDLTDATVREADRRHND